MELATSVVNGRRWLGDCRRPQLNQDHKMSQQTEVEFTPYTEQDVAERTERMQALRETGVPFVERVGKMRFSARVDGQTPTIPAPSKK